MTAAGGETLVQATYALGAVALAGFEVAAVILLSAALAAPAVLRGRGAD